MAEKICVFGPGLVGILSQSSGGEVLANSPAVLLWNVGMNHRVGPFRFFTNLSRRLAAHAIAVLRFDVSGFGDSELQAGRGTELVRAQEDLREAMALMEKRTGARRFILVGFCSGVDAAYQMAVQDERVAGVVFVEAYSFRSPSYYANLYRKYLNPYLWRRFIVEKKERIQKRLEAVGQGAKADDSSSIPEGESVFSRAYPTQARFRTDVATLVSRGVALLFIYAGISSEFSHREQFYELFCTPENREKLDVLFYERADHTLSRLSDRERAITDIVAWIHRKFGTSP